MKIFHVIATSVLGAAMAIGAGIALANSNSVVRQAKATEVNTLTIDSDEENTDGTLTATMSIGTGSNAPITGSYGVRLYANNTITVTCDANIVSMTIPWTKNSKKDFASVSANVGTYNHPAAAGDGTWTGKAQTVVFTVGSSGQIQLDQIGYTIEETKTVVSVDSVASSPEEINQDTTLDPSQVMLNVTYDDSTHGTVAATSVDLDTSTVGESIEGTAYYKSVGSAKFTIRVVEFTLAGTYVLSSKKTTPYTVITSNDLFHTNINNSENFTASSITNISVAGSPNTSDIGLGKKATEGGSVTIAAPTGYVVTTVVINGQANAEAGTTATIASYSQEIAYSGYADYTYYPLSNSFTIETATRVWAKTISITIVKASATETLANTFNTAFLGITAKACSQLAMTSTIWGATKTSFTNMEAANAAAATLVKAGEPGSVPAMARYKFCIEKYGFEDYLAKGYTQNSSVQFRLPVENNNGILIIVVVSAISAISLAGIFFIIRRRKHQ